MIQQILKADDIIFNWKPKFQEMLTALSDSASENRLHKDLLIQKMSELVTQINNFGSGSKRLEKARDELLNKLT